jgi:hypothetical protein
VFKSAEALLALRPEAAQHREVLMEEVDSASGREREIAK